MYNVTLDQGCWKRPVKVLERDCADFPRTLRIKLNPTPKLYCCGNMALLNKPSLAIVGSRRPTRYGEQIAYGIGKRCAQLGIVVVSGLARGIDVAAHKGALDNGGETIAVLGNGIDVIYPKENQKVQEDIAEKGLLVSEYELGMQPRAYHFPKRNRIISGLCQGVVIVQAEARSGSLITAEAAIEQGCEVFAVPGNINDKLSMGPNHLISEGANIVAAIDDIFENVEEFRQILNEIKMDIGSDLGSYALETVGESEFCESYRNLSGLEKQLVKFLSGGEVTLDVLSQESGLPICKLGGIITVLEMKGIVYCQMGKIGIK